MEFRALVARMDDTVFSTLSDPIEVDGRAVRGMFSSPWLAPQLGTLRTGLVEPNVKLRDADAAGVDRGAAVVFDGAGYEVVSIEPEGTGITTLVLRPTS
jgi:hypothetical protein